MTIARVRGGICAALAALFLFVAAPAFAQETPDQFDAANAEARRQSEVESQLRNQAHDLRIDQGKALLNCQGAGSAAAQSACTSNADIDMRRRGLELDNQAIRAQNTHNQILKGIGVHRVP